MKYKNQLDEWHRGGWDPPKSMQYYVQDQKSKQMATKIFSLTPSEQQAKWNDIMGQMCAYVDDTNADVDMAYDWVCEMLNISSFVDNKTAWDSFYETWESCDNRNDLSTFVINWLLWTLKSQSISQSPKIASIILFTFLTTLMTLLLTTKNVMMR